MAHVNYQVNPNNTGREAAEDSPSKRGLNTGVNLGALAYAATKRPEAAIAAFVFGAVAGERNANFAQATDLSTLLLLNK